MEIDELNLEIPDDALEEILEINNTLSEQESRYIYWRSVAYPPLEAFKKAGYSGSNWRAVETRPKIREALADLHEKIEPEYRITQKKVIGLLMEAVEIARIKEQPKTMVEAAKELAAITGVGAATKIQIDQRTQIGVINEGTRMIQQLPPETLEKFLGITRTLPSEVIEGDYEVF